ncbi:MAG: site-specific integrase [Emcibacteraceae bacterium]
MSSGFQYSGTPNLYEKAGIYYFRRQLSGQLKKILGISEIRRSLKTGNLQEARLRCAYIDLSFKRLLGETEQMISDNASPEMIEVARAYFRRELQDCLNDLELAPRNPAVTKGKQGFNRKYQAEKTLKLVNAYENMIVSEQFNSTISFEIDQAFEDMGRDIPTTNSVEYRLLGTLLCRAQAEAYRVFHQYLTKGFHDGRPLDALFMDYQSTQITNVHSKPHLSLKQLLDKHRKAKHKAITLNSKLDFERLYRWLLEWFGDEISIHNIDMDDVRSFRDTLMSMPKNYSKNKRYKNLTLKEVIKKSTNYKNVETQSIKTQKKYLSLTNAIFNWAVQDKHLDQSPFQGIKIQVLKTTPDTKGRQPFSKDEIIKILTSPLFVGFKSKSRTYIEGRMKIQTEHYWAWLIGFMSGLRIKEICLLHSRDIVEFENILCFDVNNQHGKGVKTKSSIRKVPIHDQLIDLGLLKWIKKTTKGKPNKLIFPNLIGAQLRDPSKKATSRLNRYKKNLGFPDTVKTFHSTRHSFADELRNQNVEEYSIKKLMGHSKADTTSNYGSGTSIGVLKSFIDNSYNYVDFEPLKKMK